MQLNCITADTECVGRINKEIFKKGICASPSMYLCRLQISIQAENEKYSKCKKRFYAFRSNKSTEDKIWMWLSYSWIKDLAHKYEF